MISNDPAHGHAGVPTSDASRVGETRPVLQRGRNLARRRFARLVQTPRIWKYQALSDCAHVSGAPIALQPVLLIGEGRITIGSGVEFGFPTSVAFYSGYCHVEASVSDSVIEFGDGAQINNNVFIKSEGPGIRIGAAALLGSFVTILDSDFHELDPRRRRGGQPAMGPVQLGENTFIGDGTRILKGVSIGANSVVGAGSVVTSSIPEGVIAAGNPARVIRALEDVGERRVLYR
jgi:acetyltransferase-like isoleucine patch superfamily enzyme